MTNKTLKSSCLLALPRGGGGGGGGGGCWDTDG